MNQARKTAAAELAAGYTKTHERLELFSVLAFLGLVAFTAARLTPFVAGRGWLFTWAALLGLFGADFVSGFVHWAADTWGSPAWPLVGPALIRPFRHHHVDPVEITRHGFLETNGNNCLVSIPVIGVGAFLPFHGGEPARLAASAFLLSLTLWVFGTNQFHKWAHDAGRPGWVRWLQKTGLILGVEHHNLHHRAPYTRYYCITNGWMNWLLQVTRFFRVLEWAITWTTGAIPRQDDLAITGARESDDPDLAKKPELQRRPADA